MENSLVPATVYVAIGAIIAALLTGFFSFLNLVSAKENKVSEFRLAWIDGLRDEIAIFTAAVQELLRIETTRSELEERGLIESSQEEYEAKWIESTRDAFTRAIESMARIQMRLNPKHIKEEPSSQEAILMGYINEARNQFNQANYDEAFSLCSDIRNAAAPLLKSTWDLVKLGEPDYKYIRKMAQRAIILGSGLTLLCVLSLGIYSMFGKKPDSMKSPSIAFQCRPSD
jgi:hypothetical protein